MKKILYAASVLLATLLLTLLVLSLFMKEVRYTATARVKAPVVNSWITFLDPDRQKLWQRNLEHIEALHGRPMTAGSSFRMEFSSGDSRLETVISIIPMQEYRAEIETMHYEGYRFVTFQKLNEGSRVQQTVVMRGTSLVSRGVLPVVRPLLQRDQMAALDNLADLIETSPSIDSQIYE